MGNIFHSDVFFHSLYTILLNYIGGIFRKLPSLTFFILNLSKSRDLCRRDGVHVIPYLGCFVN